MSKEETVTIPKKEYDMLQMYCHIVIESVRQNIEVVRMTKGVCDKLGLSESCNMVFPEKPEKRGRGRPRKEETKDE